ncbi:GVQW3 [Cordylochernes scorpioides]|uniref:GVQW3 n=1 Tax=Cordylochernes scorpioides TaxID=51811 RepID=A0ABY6LLK1_9ARAC|nr:GVQW3 [Cordylochernes scorpioides]
MVACGISYEGKLKIRKVERNAKINSEYYQNNILEPIFLNDIPSIYGKQSNKVWFHHDNATSHTSSSTQAYLEDLRQRTGINTISKNRTPTYELIKEAFGDAALSRSITFEWFSRFLKGREKVNDDQLTGRPRSLRCEENKLKMKELIKSNRRISIKDLSSET